MPATSVAVDPPVEPEPDNAGGGKGRLAKSPPPGWLFYFQNKGDQGHEQTNGMHLMVRVGSSHVSQQGCTRGTIRSRAHPDRDDP